MIRANASRETSRLLAVVVTVAVIAALVLAKVVLLPLALAILFAFLLAPVVGLLERVWLPRIVAIALVLLAFGGGVGVIGWTVGGQLIQVTNHLHDYRWNIAKKVRVFHSVKNTSLTQAQHEVQQLGAQLGVSQSPNSNAASNRRSELGGSPKHPLNVREVPKSSTTLESLPTILDPLAALLIVIVFTFFMLLEREDLRNRLIRLTGRGHLTQTTQAMDEASSRISRYFRLQLLVNVCYGSLIFVALHFLGLPHAMLWGALAALLRFIPYIGAPIAALLPTLLSIAVFDGWEKTFIIMGVFFCVELSTANFVEPRLYGKHTGLSPLAILVAAIFWTLIWGPIGLILSVPLTACLVVVGSHVPSLEFLKVLLGDEPVMRPHAHYYQRLLAGDEREASEVLDDYLKENSLEDLYDSVVIPALSMAELDRHRNALDDTTANFINQTTKELVVELGLRSEKLEEDTKEDEAEKMGPQPGDSERIAPVAPRKIVCVPVRDAADEIAGIMLAQILERAGHRAQALAIGNPDAMLAMVAQLEPDLIVLSALPPYAMSHARGIYKRLHAQDPRLEILIGFWGYGGDTAKAARIISFGKKDCCIDTTLAEAVEEAGNRAGDAEPETGPRNVSPISA